MYEVVNDPSHLAPRPIYDAIGADEEVRVLLGEAFQRPAGLTSDLPRLQIILDRFTCFVVSSSPPPCAPSASEGVNAPGVQGSVTRDSFRFDYVSA